jgi:hypothetical protein
MKSYGLPFSFFLILAIATALACGSPAPHIVPNCSSAASGTNTTGIPQSVSVCPAAADARNYPEGQVQFMATGYYGTPPVPVTPIQAFWGACSQKAPTNAVLINNSGLAQCAADASGTYTVFASEPTTCNTITACGGGCQISGYAQLTCP